MRWAVRRGAWTAGIVLGLMAIGIVDVVTGTPRASQIRDLARALPSAPPAPAATAGRRGVSAT